MRIKDVVGECLVKMGEENFVDNETYSDGEEALVNKILGALNIAYREIVYEYLPLVATQTANVVGGKIDADDLNENILYPVSIKRKGEKVSFYTDATCIYVSGEGEVEIKYAYMPSKMFSLGDSINDMRLSVSILSDAALAEYYFQEKVFELAKSFDADFRAQIGLVRYKGRTLRVKRRRWQA